MALTVYRHLYGYGNGRIKIAANLCAVHLFSVLLWRRHGGDRRASSGNYVGQHTGHWPRPPDTCIRWPVVTREGWAGGHQLWPHQCQCHLRPDTLSVPGLGWGMTPGQGGTFSLHFFFCHVSNISPFQRYKVNLQSLVFPKHCKHSHKILYFHSTTLIIWAFILQISSFHS